MPTPEDHEHEDALAGLFSSFLAAEPPFKRVLLAIGHTVTAAATLEKTLGIMIAHRSAEQHQGSKTELADFLVGNQKRTAGKLLNLLKGDGIPDDLAERIDDVAKRRNLLVHHPLEDPHILAALTRGEGATEVAAKILVLAEDCDRLSRELQPAATDGVESAFGMTIPEMMALTESFDAGKISDPARRAFVEKFQEMRRINPIQHPPRQESD